ncbi:hypothetical protein O6H91_11G049400 [Diphasiastrum complanatum]|uniref:Uncharacterized protein n=1 Tax=Diphasiastrum complanatum TaxID=34168 RepID=A0ACC2C8Z2_DIPCM|nr:hypothetical protein O6H91_11G049400 [Diphasiastrum complanatum]
MVVVEGHNYSNNDKVTEVQLFREDVVESVAHSSLIGMVSKVGGDSSDSSSSSSSDGEEEDGDDESEEVCEGCARVCWINADETTEKISDIRVLDRAFLHGDVVASASDPLGQTGTVVNVDLLVDLEFPNGEVVTKVSSRKLRRVRAFMPGDYVIHNQWLGRVDEVVDHVTVSFDDGSKCKVMRADPEKLVPVLESAIGDSGCPYYPGLRVRSTSSSLFKGARWLRGSWKASRMEGVVADVEAGSVLVYWIAAGNAWENSQSFVPAEQQDPKGLVPLTYFSYTNWQLGDRSLPPKGLRSRGGVSPLVEVAPSDGDGEAGLEIELPGSAAEGNATLEGQGTNNAGATIGELQQDSWTGHRRKSRRCSVKREKRKSKKKDEAVESAALIVNTKTTVDVTWQDGTRSRNVPACSLIPVDHLGDHDFWPDQYVLERGSDGEGIDTQVRRVGIVKSVDSKQRIAKVTWLKPVQRPEDPREFEREETVSVYELIEHPDYTYCLADVVIRLSLALDIATHVTRKPLDDSEGGSSAVEDNSEQEGEENEAELSGKERVTKSRDQERKKSHSGSQDLSWVGVITGLEEGDIEVAWANGMVSKAIFVVSRDDDESSTLTSDVEDIVGEDGDDAASWETVDSTGMDELDQDDQLEHVPWTAKMSWEPLSESESANKCKQQTQGIGETSQDQNDDSVSEIKEEFLERRPARFGGPLTFLLAAIGFMSRFAGSLLGLRGAKKILEVDGAHSNADSPARILNNQGGVNGETVTAEEGSRNLEQNSQQHPSVLQLPNNPSTSLQIQHHTGELINIGHQKEKDTYVPSSDVGSLSESRTTIISTTVETDCKPECEDNDDLLPKNFEKPELISGGFGHFDSVKDARDHHYFSETGQASSQRKWVKKIQQEWNILEKSLPDTIFVRVYEERMDLLRTVILGAAGTPYHDGLFVFDIYLPPEYPSVPPVAYYHSGGLRLNPNLYENGKVCLSLLNTWAGKGLEVWNPASSSILQVLVSIQGLVLNAKPYFNEAGYDRQVGTPEGEKNSLVYNENSFLLSCKSMLYLLRRPPKHFEELIQYHFKARGSHILLACKAYLSGAPVGSFADAPITSPKAGNDFQNNSSEGFKLMLAKLVPRLATAFSEAGAICEDCYYHTS